MKAKWNVWKTVVVILAIIIVAGGSFWGYTKVKGNNDAKVVASVVSLQQQLGVATKTENIKKVNPDEIFITAVTTSDNITHILIEISGVWGQWGQFNATP